MKTKTFSKDDLDKLSRREFHAFMVENYAFAWTEDLIDRYHDKMDWVRLTYKYSDNIQWTPALLEKYKQQIRWDILSDYSFFFNNKKCHKIGVETLFTTENLTRFADILDWKALSANLDFMPKMLEVSKDYIDWNELINRGYDEDKNKFVGDGLTKWFYKMNFFIQYEAFIPQEEFLKSLMWKQILEDYKKSHTEELFQLVYNQYN